MPSTPMPLNSPEVLRGRELAVAHVEGIRWLVVATLQGPSQGMSTSRLRLRSIPGGTLSEVGWLELRARLLAGVVVVR
jgi:hypothetical protein